MKTIDKLIESYSKSSKHSNYQILPKCLKGIIGEDQIAVKTRFERERLEYILKKIDVRDKSILDIGGNTGFFSFELIECMAKKIHYYEGNKNHADFVRLAAEILSLDKKIIVTNKYYSFENSADSERHDIGLLLNVLHHIGDDYGDGTLSIEKARHSIIEQINNLSNKTDILVFQLGFNWQGNIKRPLFDGGTKREMVDFIVEGVKNSWVVLNVGVAEAVKKGIKYCDLNDNNIKRNDELGEFLNRPLFILKSK